MADRPKILITNDDGIHSEGIEALEGAMLELGDVYVVAPESEMSGASHSLTLARPLRIRQRGERHWTVDGTPTDCVTLALNKILSADEMPQVCASGINHGGNLGDDARTELAFQVLRGEALEGAGEPARTAPHPGSGRSNCRSRECASAPGPCRGW